MSEPTARDTFIAEIRQRQGEPDAIDNYVRLRACFRVEGETMFVHVNGTTYGIPLWLWREAPKRMESDV